MKLKIASIVAAAGLFAATAGSVAAQTPDGAALFRMRCGSCHSVVPGGPAVLGPSLAGVVGRKSGSTTFNYSPAMKASNVIWTRANLDRYLQGPMRMIPGTRMVIAISDAGQRAAILNFLARPPAAARPK